MPAWITLYFFAYAGFTAWSVADDIRSKTEPLWFSISEVFGDACLVAVALAFWFAPVQRALSGASLVVFASGLALLLGQAGRAFHRQVISDTELSLNGKLFVGVIGSSLVVAISAPLVFWGFKSAVLGANNGTWPSHPADVFADASRRQLRG